MSNLKLGLLGNVNCYPYHVAKLLRGMGWEVLLHVDAPAGETLHRPEATDPSVGPEYPDWIREDSALRLRRVRLFPPLFGREVLSRLRACDAVILNGLAHGFGAYLPRSIPSVALFSGADLDVMGDRTAAANRLARTSGLKSKFRAAATLASVELHRRGVAHASMFTYFPRGMVPSGDTILESIFHGRPVVRFEHCHVVTDGIGYAPPPENARVRVFNLTRFLWKKPLPLGATAEESKGNDIMVRGLALYRRRFGTPLDVHFVEKGLHVGETKALLRELGVEDLVTWHAEMAFPAFLEQCRASDIIFEQLGDHVFTGGYYPMLMGRPVIGNGRPEIMQRFTGAVSPICQATTPEEVCSWLARLVPDKGLRRTTGLASRAFVLAHLDLRHEARFIDEHLRTEVLRRQGRR